MRKILIIFAIIILPFLPSAAFSWGPITHYHITREVDSTDIFSTAGMYPDTFNTLDFWADVAHSPGLVSSDADNYPGDPNPIPFPYADRPNLAFIMEKISKNKDQSDMAKGWGAHIAADWHAHSLLFIPDFNAQDGYDEKLGKFLITLLHIGNEVTLDIYNFVVRGSAPTKFRFYPEQIWKGFVNWKLIEEHEATIKLPVVKIGDKYYRGERRDYTLCQMAIKNPALTCPEEDLANIQNALGFVSAGDKKILVDMVKNQFRNINAILTVEQNGIRVLAVLQPAAIVSMVASLRVLGIESTLTESKNVIAQWLLDKKARGIPDPYNPLTKTPALARVGVDAKPRLAFDPNEITFDTELGDPHKLFFKFWQDVATKAFQKNAIQTIETQETDSSGNKFTGIDTQILNQDLLQQALSETINEWASSSDYISSRFGKWTKRVFLEGQLDPEVILDFELPVAEILSPSDLDIVNFNPLVISGSVSDKNFLSYTLEFGAGENPASFTKICDGTQAVQENTLCTWDTTSLSGTYTLRLSATDKNDNENVTTTKVFLGSPIFVSSFGSIGKAAGQFNQPTGIALDAQGNLYIADTQNDRIQKLDTNFNVVSSISGKNLLKQPEGVFVDAAGNVFVADTMNHQVKKFDSSGTLLLTFGKKGNANGEFNQTAGIGVSSENKIYVTDRQNDRVQVFDSSGAFQFAFGTQGSDTGQFNKPQGLFIGFGDNVFVADSLNNRLQMFTKEGQFVFAANHEAFKHPHAISMDKNINVYIADTFHHRIVKADRFGNPMFLLGTHGKETSQFNQPQGVAVSSDGSTLYIADSLNHRVQKFQVKLSPSPSQTVAKNTEEKKDNKELSDNDATLASAILTAPNPVRTGDIRFVYKLTGKGKKKAKEGALSIHIEVYTLTGKRIATFDCNAIDETCNWQQSLSNGVYVYRLLLSESGGPSESKIGKIVVVK